MAYAKHNFKTKSVIASAALNEMDAQIAANEASVAEMGLTLSSHATRLQSLEYSDAHGGGEGGGTDSTTAAAAAASATAADTSAKAAESSATAAASSASAAKTSSNSAASSASSAGTSKTAAEAAKAAAEAAQAKAEQAASSAQSGGGSGGGTITTATGPGTITAASGWTIANLRNVKAGPIGQWSFRVTSPSTAQGAEEWVIATASAPLNEVCPAALIPVVWCADTTNQVQGTGLWEKATGKIRLHCSLGLAASQPLIVSCVYVAN